MPLASGRCVASPEAASAWILLLCLAADLAFLLLGGGLAGESSSVWNSSLPGSSAVLAWQLVIDVFFVAPSAWA